MLQPTSSHLFLFSDNILKKTPNLETHGFHKTDFDANYYHNHFHHNWDPHLSDSGIMFRVNESFVVVGKVSCCFRGQFPPSSLPCLLSFSSLCLLLLPWLNIWMQHPLMITQHTAMTHNQPAKNTHKDKTHSTSDFQLLREARCDIFFFSCSPSQALLNSIYAFSQLFFTLSHFLLFAFCLMCACRLTKDTLPLHPSIFSSVSFPPSLLFAIERSLRQKP